MNFYNNWRPHRSLDDRTPAEVYAGEGFRSLCA
ncbi:MAG TPA: hypothetical protein PLH34_10060 [Bacillota bacterium]|nr:hypothetical protein [Bacillota bacterium]